MPTDADPDLRLRGRLLRSLGQLREMLPGSFVERKRACGRPNCHCADGKNLHTQYQISVLVDGQTKTFNIPAALVQQVREKIELRRRFERAASLHDTTGKRSLTRCFWVPLVSFLPCTGSKRNATEALSRNGLARSVKTPWGTPSNG